VDWIKKRARRPERALESRTDGGETRSAAPRLVEKPRPSLASGGDFPRFQSTASDELAPGNRDPFAAARLKLRKAYTPAHPVNDRVLFAGRRGLLQTMIRAIEDGRSHTIVYGQRGIGKTSLLQVIADAAREARYVVAYVSCGATGSFDETFRAIALEIPLMFHSAYGPKALEAEQGGVFADVLRAGPVTPRLAADLCSKVTGTRVLVIVDEFDRCGSQDFRRDMTEFLKSLSDRSVRVQLLIAGVAENLDELLETGVLLQRNVLALEVPQMSEVELRDLIGIGQQVSGLTFEPGAVDLLISAAGGLPYIASLLAQHAGLCALSAERMSITSADLLAAIDQAVLEMKGRIPRESLSHLSRLLRQRAENLIPILARVAGNPDGRFSQDDITAAPGGPLETARALALVERFARECVLIRHDGDAAGRYRFIDQTIAPLLWLVAVRSAYEHDEAGGHAQPIPAEHS
jgi:hypothetical protein